LTRSATSRACRGAFWDERELAAELDGDRDALAGWLAGVGVDVDQLEPAPESYDPDCE